MSIKKISTLLLVTAVVSLLAVLAFHVKVGATADSIAVLKTTGMTCGSCSSRITKALESIKGVSVTEVDVEGGWVIVGYDTMVVKPSALAEKVSGTGFGSNIHVVLTPEQFKQITGRSIGHGSNPPKGCSGGKGGGCGGNKQS